MRCDAIFFAVVLSLGLAAVQAGSVEGSAVITVGNGPFAGTYNLDPHLASCMHSKTRKTYSMGFKDFDAHGSKALAEGGMEVSEGDHSDRFGNLIVTFGDPDKIHTTYNLSHGAAKLKVNGSAVSMALDGTTDSRINISMNVLCGETLEVP